MWTGFVHVAPWRVPLRSTAGYRTLVVLTLPTSNRRATKPGSAYQHWCMYPTISDPHQDSPRFVWQWLRWLAVSTFFDRTAFRGGYLYRACLRCRTLRHSLRHDGNRCGPCQRWHQLTAQGASFHSRSASCLGRSHVPCFECGPVVLGLHLSEEWRARVRLQRTPQVKLVTDCVRPWRALCAPVSILAPSIPVDSLVCMCESRRGCLLVLASVLHRCESKA